jgi:hypothetical protein
MKASVTFLQHMQMESDFLRKKCTKSRLPDRSSSVKLLLTHSELRESQMVQMVEPPDSVETSAANFLQFWLERGIKKMKKLRIFIFDIFELIFFERVFFEEKDILLRCRI